MTRGDEQRIAAELADPGATPLPAAALAIPENDLAAIRRYCEERIPAQYQDEVRVECVKRGTHVTIFECRTPWNLELSNEWSRQPVAQLRYLDGQWTLFCADRNGRWHRYSPTQPSSRVGNLLADITADPTGIFWG